MNCAAILFPVFNPYQKATLEIYLSGCFRNCTNCHNEELSNYDVGEVLNDEYIENKILKLKNYFSIVCITGGDLLCQDDREAYNFVKTLKNHLSDKEFWLFTGEDDFEKIPLWCKENFDIIKYGTYKEELKTNMFPASANQKIYKRKEIENDLLS